MSFVEEPSWEIPAEFNRLLLDTYGLTCPPRYGIPRNPERKSIGHRVCDVMCGMNMPPMPHQQYIADLFLELHPTANPKEGYFRFSYERGGISIMRQQGKSAIIYAFLLLRLISLERQLCIYTAQDRNYARQRLEEEIWVEAENLRLGKHRLGSLFTKHMTNGNERVKFSLTGSRLRIMANTPTSGHGPPVNFAAMDEVFALKDDALYQALSPATKTKRDAQILWASAAGDETSIWLNAQRKAGRLSVQRYWTSGGTEWLRGGPPPPRWPKAAYVEWSAPQGAPAHSRETWLRYMPALCSQEDDYAGCTCDPEGKWHHTFTLDGVESEYEMMSGDPGAFERAYLNRTRIKVRSKDSNIPDEEWEAAIKPDSYVSGDITFAIDVNVSREFSSVVAVSLNPEGIWDVELVTRRRGTQWIAGVLLRLRELHNPLCFAIDSKSPAGAVIQDITEAGILVPEDPQHPDRGQLYVLSTSDILAGTGQFVDLLKAGRVRRIDQPTMSRAVGDAISRPVGDGWLFGRRPSGSDVSPATATVSGMYAHRKRFPLINRKRYDLTQSVS